MRLGFAAAVLVLVAAGQAPASAGSPGETAPACSPGPARPATAVEVETPAPTGVRETRVHWTRWSTRLVHGERATLHGQVVTDDGAVPGADVDLLARPAGADAWREVASASSDPDTGVFAFDCVPAEATTRFRVVYRGSLLHAPSRAERTVAVARWVPDRMVPKPSGLRLVGSVSPAYAGRPVLLQRRTCQTCTWKVVDRRAADSDSEWRFRVAVPRSGAWGYRVKVPADARFVTGYGDHVWRVTR